MTAGIASSSCSQRGSGAGPWLHVPVGKLREDRYLPLHPHLVALIDQYRAAHVDPANPLLLPRENGKPADRHAVTRYINKAGAAAGLPHIHPHQLRHTLATQAINRERRPGELRERPHLTVALTRMHRGINGTCQETPRHSLGLPQQAPIPPLV